MSERTEKKLAQIAKIEKRLAKWEASRNLDGFHKKNNGWMQMWLTNNPQYNEQDYINAFYPNYLKDVDWEIKHAKEDLETAKAQLVKIKASEIKKQTEEDIMNSMPTAIIDFMEKTIKAWDTYDLNMRARIIEEKKSAITREDRAEIVKKYGAVLIRISRMTTEEIKNENAKFAKILVLNLYKRVRDITGEITDARGLHVTMGNNGYAVINGNIIGKDGRAVVESIGAGGYNIQRWHIRTLVKQY